MQHFFFSSPIYTVARERYLQADLRSYSVKDLLHGKTNLTSQENEALFCKYRISSSSLEDLYSIPNHQPLANVLNGTSTYLTHSF